MIMPLLWIIIVLSRFSHSALATDSLCHFQDEKAICNNLNLSYIPPIPANVRELLFMGNELLAVSQETFVNVTQPSAMTNLVLASNGIASISSDSFDSFKNLRSLDLSHNEIGTNDLSLLLPALAANLKLDKLILVEVGRNPITDEAFSFLNSSLSSKLVLTGNEIATLSPSSLGRLGHIQNLVLDNNRLQEILFPNMNYLQTLSINQNQLMDIPTFCSDENSSTPLLRNLYLDSNLIHRLNAEAFRCLPSLQQISLSFNFINVLEDGIFSYASKLSMFTLISSPGEKVTVKGNALRSDTLEYIHIGFRGHAYMIFDSAKETFQGLPSLKKLYISYTSMRTLSIQQQFELFSPLTGLTRFECSGCRLVGNPYHVLQNKPHLQFIDLSSNSIQDLTLDTDMSNLTNLKLANNKITYVHKERMHVEMLDRLQRFDISDNPFVCDCDSVWFIDWLKKTNHSKLRHFPNKYKCSYPPEFAGKLLTEVHFSYLHCLGFTTAEWIGMVAGPLVVVFLILCTVLYLNRWNIMFFIYMRRRRQTYVRIQDDDADTAQ